MPQKSGIEIYKRFYPWPDTFRLGDPVLVSQVTGMTWPEFSQAYREQNEAIQAAQEMNEEPPEPDQTLVTGLIAVAFWQGNQHMNREKVRRAVERIPIDEVEFIEGDDVEEDAGPPAEAETAGSTRLTISSASDGSPEAEAKTEIPPDSTSDETSPNGSGSPGSPKPLPESLQA